MNILKERIKLLVADPRWRMTMKRLKEGQKKKVVLFGTPMHGNLGDHAIAIQEQYFFEDFKFLFYVHDKKNLSKQKILSNTYFSFMKCFPYIRYR